MSTIGPPLVVHGASATCIVLGQKGTVGRARYGHTAGILESCHRDGAVRLNGDQAVGIRGGKVTLDEPSVGKIERFTSTLPSPRWIGSVIMPAKGSQDQAWFFLEYIPDLIITQTQKQRKSLSLNRDTSLKP